jgi:multiple sugar transport system substrate-binding protein
MESSTSKVPQVLSAQASRRGFLLGSGALGLTAFLAACGGGGSGSEGNGTGSIRALFMKQAGYQEGDIQGMTASFHKANPDIKVSTDFVSYDALHDKITAAAPAGTYDMVLIDVIWPAEFGSRNIIADVTARWPQSWKEQMLGGAVLTPKYDGKFYGVPWILDTKYFFFNTAHLKKANVDPGSLDTWDGVMGAARKLKAAGVVQYPLVWSWQQAEALICDYTQLLGAYGGSFLDNNGKPAFNQGGGVQALEFMRKSIVDKLTNPTSTQSVEEDVRRVFSAGQASMALNWTYMYALADDPKQSQIAGDVAVLQTPQGAVGRPGVNGSMALAISPSSKNQQAAWKYITHLTSQPVQNKFAAHSLPVWKSSYEDPEVIKTNPAVVPVAKKQLGDLILRPQVTNYNAMSLALRAEIQNALLGNKSAQQALDDAASKASSLLGS